MKKVLTSVASWVVRGGVTASPLVSSLAKNKVPAVSNFWPPLGSIEIFAASLATAIIGFASILPSIFKDKVTGVRYAVASISIAVVVLFTYAYLLSQYVITDITPYNGIQYRTIGSQRTEVALQCCPNYTDEELLQFGGLKEGDIKKMWTKSSIRSVKIELFASCVLGLSLFNFAVGSLARAKKRR